MLCTATAHQRVEQRRSQPADFHPTAPSSDVIAPLGAPSRGWFYQHPPPTRWLMINSPLIHRWFTVVVIAVTNDVMDVAGGLACFIHELSSFEKTGHVLTTQTAHEFLVGQHQVDSASNVLSTSDTHSCHSTSSTSYPSMSETTLDSHNEHDTSFSGYSYHAPTITFPLCN